MKVWSRTLTRADLFECAVRVNAEFPGVRIYVALECELVDGPRSRRLEHVHLRSEAGTRRPNHAHSGAVSDGYAASWTEWGWWLARVFERDPNARCGVYRGLDDFHAQTNRRFRDPRTPRERQLKRLIAA